MPATMFCPVCQGYVQVVSKRRGLGSHFDERHPDVRQTMANNGGVASKTKSQHAIEEIFQGVSLSDLSPLPAFSSHSPPQTSSSEPPVSDSSSDQSPSSGSSCSRSILGPMGRPILPPSVPESTYAPPPPVVSPPPNPYAFLNSETLPPVKCVFCAFQFPGYSSKKDVGAHYMMCYRINMYKRV